MALAERLWTRDGPVDGLGLVPGIAVLPHFDPGRATRLADASSTLVGRLTWLGLDERTLVIGRPGGDVDGRGARTRAPSVPATQQRSRGRRRAAAHHLSVAG